MSSFSRRDFLATSSLTVAGLSLGLGRSAMALPRHVISSRSRKPVSALVSDMIDPAILRALAQGGVEAAQQAGATYADIRVADVRALTMLKYDDIVFPYSFMDFDYVYGLRVRVGGVWSVTFGANPTADAITRAARAAVKTAKGMVAFAVPKSDMAPAPVVRGEWATPVQIDPFSVSPDEHVNMLNAYQQATKRVPDSSLVPPLRSRWIKETRVFASTEGSLITQRLVRSEPQAVVEVKSPNKEASRLAVPGFAPSSAGFESMLGPDIQEKIKETVEEAARLASYPEARAEVGRYDAIVDGSVFGGVVGATLPRALEMDRVLGYEANMAGTSFLAPADEVLGQQLFSPHLNMISDRTFPHYRAAKWDDEGVATEAFPVIAKGCVVDYFATRSTAPALAAWHAKRGTPVTSHGSAISLGPTLPPTGCASHLSIGTGSTGMTLDDMVKQVSNGILVRGIRSLDVDQQLAGGLLIPNMMYEVKQGQITRRLIKGGVQFSTKTFGKLIATMGDASTIQYSSREEWRGARSICVVTAPAAHLSRLDVVQIGGGV